MENRSALPRDTRTREELIIIGELPPTIMTLRELRARRELTQKDIAEKMAIDVMTYNHWENGKRSINMNLYPPLAEALSVSLPVLVYILLGKMPPYDDIYWRHDYVSFPIETVIFYGSNEEKDICKGRLVMTADDFVHCDMQRELLLRRYGTFANKAIIKLIVDHCMLELTRQGEQPGLCGPIEDYMFSVDMEFRGVSLPHAQNFSFSSFMKEEREFFSQANDMDF